MCTSIIFIRKSDKWPIIIGSNRDEDLDRKSKLPGQHWKKSFPNIIAGKDQRKNGAWIGINDFGMVSLIHNRNTKNKESYNTSRGHIVLNVLKNNNIDNAIDYLSKIDPLKYNNFNLLIACFEKCYWIKNDYNNNKLIIKELGEGLSIMTEKDLNDQNDMKIKHYFEMFSSLQVPDPSRNNWDDWANQLTNYENKDLGENKTICFIDRKNNYGTKSSSLIAIPKRSSSNRKIIFKSTKNLPLSKNYTDVTI